MTEPELFAGRYRLEGRLGAGGMSTVRLAFDTRLERFVAVKLLAEHLADDPSFVARFRREALAAARLVHPNVVQVYDFGLDEPTHQQFIVMEHIDGMSCAQLLREHGALHPDDVVAIIGQACAGLAYAHRNGVIHRDVKPGNLLRSKDGVVKLADFGIAKASEQSAITKAGSVLGTAAYLAPEQTRGEPAGPRTDLYALGVVAYQLLAGRLPYEASSLSELALLQERADPPPIDVIAPGVPPALAHAVTQALARHPEDRYAGPDEFRAAIEGGLHGVEPEPTAATRAMTRDDATDATRAMPRTARRRPLEPLPEPPPPQRRQAAARPVAERPARRRRASPLRTVRRLFALVLLVGLGVIAYTVYDTAQQTRDRVASLNPDIGGTVDQAVEDFIELVRENTR